MPLNSLFKNFYKVYLKRIFLEEYLEKLNPKVVNNALSLPAGKNINSKESAKTPFKKIKKIGEKLEKSIQLKENKCFLEKDIKDQLESSAVISQEAPSKFFWRKKESLPTQTAF